MWCLTARRRSCRPFRRVGANRPQGVAVVVGGAALAACATVAVVRHVRWRLPSYAQRCFFTSPVVVRAAVLTVSDTVSAGAGTDRGGPAVVEALAAVGDALGGLVVVETAVVPDEVPAIAAILAKWCDGGKVDLVLTTGGTGFSPVRAHPFVAG